MESLSLASGTVDLRVGKGGTAGTALAGPLNIRFKPFFVPSIKDRPLFVEEIDSRDEDASLESARPVGKICSGSAVISMESEEEDANLCGSG
jgi:hypothetical protein